MRRRSSAGWRRSRATIDSMVKRGRIDEPEKARAHGADPGHARLPGALAGRRRHRGRVREHGSQAQHLRRSSTRSRKPGAVLATNTSTLDIDPDRAGHRAPAGCHRHAFLFAGQRHAAARGGTHRPTRRAPSRPSWSSRKPLRKTPVLARVCYGFIGNRMMEGYAREAQRMVLEGATPREVDTRAREAGAWPWASSRCSTWPASTSA